MQQPPRATQLPAVLPWFGYSLEVTRATAFHFMAIGQLFLTYHSRHTRSRPLRNPYLHTAVVTGVAIQFAAASRPFTANQLGNAAIPLEIWGVVLGGALVAWGLAELCARVVWRQSEVSGDAYERPTTSTEHGP